MKPEKNQKRELIRLVDPCNLEAVIEFIAWVRSSRRMRLKNCVKS